MNNVVDNSKSVNHEYDNNSDEKINDLKYNSDTNQLKSLYGSESDTSYYDNGNSRNNSGNNKTHQQSRYWTPEEHSRFLEAIEK